MSGHMMAELKPTVLRWGKCKRDGWVSKLTAFPLVCLPLLLKLKHLLRKERRRGRGKERLLRFKNKGGARFKAQGHHGKEVRNQAVVFKWNHLHSQTSDAYYHVSQQSQIYITAVIINAKLGFLISGNSGKLHHLAVEVPEERWTNSLILAHQCSINSIY